MSAKLLAIEPNPPIPPEVIEILTEVCGWVEKDEVSALAIAVIHRDGSASSVWTGSPNAPALLGAIERLKYRVLQSMDD